MALVSLFVVLASACLVTSASITRGAEPITEGTELVFAFMMHRHGDRTPVLSTLPYIGLDDYSEIEALIEPWGYGQLTDAGKRTGYKTGQFIRRRYNELISEKYNRSEMYVRSTDSSRTKMTVLTALSAIYPALPGSWSDVINWEPIPYITVPVLYDFNQPFYNCPVFEEFYSEVMRKPDARMDPYTDLIKKVAAITGTDVRSTPNEINYINDVYISLDSLGYNISEEMRELMPLMEEATGVSWDITTGNENNLHYQAGVLLNEFFEYANEVIAGNGTPKVRIYSAHDFNVYSLEAISRVVPRLGAPKYGSLFSLELRRVSESGQYVVLPVYLADPHEGVETYLQVKGCGDSALCDYLSFYNLTSSSLRDVTAWRTECGFDPSIIIDSSGVD